MADLEKQIATEDEFNKYILDKINSLDIFGAAPFFENFTEKENLKKQGFDLEFYKEGGKVYYISHMPPSK